MGTRKILTVGFQVAAAEIHHTSFRSKKSLLDWDIILFQPDIREFLTYQDNHRGKPSLHEKTSFELREYCEHWHREIGEATKAGKTVITFLTALRSEFDVVFESDEGRLIGEAEGKDNKPINVEKLRQLAMNVQEDLQREEVTTPAKPVLFGNAFRLLPLAERAGPFTKKCVDAAASSSTALVPTPDLFPVVQYLASHEDAEYARSCREVLLTSVGRVVFPALPPSSSGTK